MLRMRDGSLHRKNILILGDSNSFLPNYRQCWPAVLARKAAGSLCVFNESLPGRTTGFDENELNTCCILEKRLGRYVSLGFVFVMLGTNDVKMRYGPPALGTIEHDFEIISETICERRKECSLVFLLPPPIAPTTGDDFYRGDERIRDVCDVIARLCHRRELPLLDTHSILDAECHLESDAVHINESGRILIAAVVYDYLINSGLRDGNKIN